MLKLGKLRRTIALTVTIALGGGVALTAASAAHATAVLRRLRRPGLLLQ